MDIPAVACRKTFLVEGSPVRAFAASPPVRSLFVFVADHAAHELGRVRSGNLSVASGVSVALWTPSSLELNVSSCTHWLRTNWVERTRPNSLASFVRDYARKVAMR